jgi:hypothetical protein
MRLKALIWERIKSWIRLQEEIGLDVVERFERALRVLPRSRFYNG